MTQTFLKPAISGVRSLGPMTSRVTIEPLERGFGHTLGNALRRVMMSSIPGFAATEVKINGIMHEYDRVEGMREDVVWLILNLKNVIFKLNDSDREVVKLVKKGPCTVVAGDIQLSQHVEIVNPDHVLAVLTKSGELEMEIVVESGVGYQPASIIEGDSKRVGALYLDASFCPVKRMNFSVGSTRHENRVDLDRLIMDIESNGIFTCEEIIRYASRILIDQFKVFSEVGGEETVSVIENVGAHREAQYHPLFSEKVETLDLAVRSLNCLRQESIRYIGELVQREEKELMRMPNLGRKSLLEIKQALATRDLSLGVEVSSWKAPR
ncbi:DNA-directed RNA polymerase subunit alpha [Candidatus Persebacteraceae bacterium Df01]|uniref:DNA-directed RNA polymerase subunit alpha n=1 Tax=Candidatus Doriopsillibacter californiensis TaxID=2970740 RepID=A0ABT7QNK4_9GAMM|nr:DNA-directed RNA polymerase subunit alpha [Candidatus Persebacteraceae bacterium Df01]